MRAFDPVLDATFAGVVFDWDGTAVPDRHADASAVTRRIEELCALGVEVVVVSGSIGGRVGGPVAGRRDPGRIGRAHR